MNQLKCVICALVVFLIHGACWVAQIGLAAAAELEEEKDRIEMVKSLAAADVLIECSPSLDGWMGIRIGPRTPGDKESSNIEKEFSLTSKPLQKFFDEQPRKDLLLIMYGKSEQEDAEIKAISVQLRDYFIARGYKRILIGQYTNNNSGPYLLLEHPKTQPPAPAEAPQPQPAPKP